MDIIYSTDDNYAKYAGVSILSLLDNNKHIDKININIIDNNISLQNKNNIYSIVKSYNRNLRFINFNDICNKLNKKDNFSEAAYGRLFISNMSKVDKILYLDCDTIINGDLSDIWNTNIDNYFVAGVQDNPAKEIREVIGMSKKDRYINSGVLLMNLKRLREVNIEQQVVAFIDKYNGIVAHHDQGIINGLFKKQIKILEPKYNAMPQFWQFDNTQIKKLYDIEDHYTNDEILEARRKPIIIHYINKFYGRPWVDGCKHPMKSLYIKYLNESPWDNNLEAKSINIKLAMRKFVYNKFPFYIYCKVEHLLDIKRRKQYKKIYMDN